MINVFSLFFATIVAYNGSLHSLNIPRHLRKVEESLTAAIAAAKIAGMSNTELVDTLQTLLSMDEL